MIKYYYDTISPPFENTVEFLYKDEGQNSIYFSVENNLIAYNVLCKPEILYELQFIDNSWKVIEFLVGKIPDFIPVFLNTENLDYFYNLFLMISQFYTIIRSVQFVGYTNTVLITYATVEF